jgi:raffinose/stachyose/melibiose transport system substrate-binding protein
MLVLSLLAGCGGQKQSGETTKATEEKKEEPKKQAEPVTIKFFNWYNNEGVPYADKLVELVKEKMPNVTLELEMVNWDTMHPTLQTRIAANEVPDLIDFKGQDIPKYAKAGHLMELTGKPFMQDLPKAATEAIKVEGKDYGIPYTALYQGVLYNKKIFAENSIEIPKTYDELMQIAEKLQSKGITPFATHFKDNWNIGNITMQFAMSEVFNKNPRWGYDLYEGKVSFAESPEYRAVFEHVKDVYKYTFKDTYSIELTKSDELFAKGKAAMNITGTWSITNIEAVNPELDYGIFPFPGKDPGAKLIFEPDHTFAASAKTKHPEEVLKVLELVATDKKLAQFCIDNLKTHSLLKDVMPSTKSPVLKDIDNYKNNNQIVDVSIGNTQILWPYQEEYSRYITEWLFGKKTLDEALKAADAYKDKVKLN